MAKAGEKLSHTEVNYGKGMRQSHCSICEHYIPRTRFRRPACKLVRPPIAPGMWCERFKPKD